MEKQIRNAGKFGEKAHKDKRRNLPALLDKSGDRFETVPALQDGAQAIEQGTQAVVFDETKTFEVINGHVVFFLVVPCVKSKPDRIKPLYLVETNELGGPERGFWQCEQCTRIFHTRKAWAKHAGMIMNIPTTCEVYK